MPDARHLASTIEMLDPGPTGRCRSDRRNPDARRPGSRLGLDSSAHGGSRRYRLSAGSARSPRAWSSASRLTWASLLKSWSLNEDAVAHDRAAAGMGRCRAGRRADRVLAPRCPSDPGRSPARDLSAAVLYGALAPRGAAAGGRAVPGRVGRRGGCDRCDRHGVEPARQARPVHRAGEVRWVRRPAALGCGGSPDRRTGRALRPVRGGRVRCHRPQHAESLGAPCWTVRICRSVTMRPDGPADAGHAGASRGLSGTSELALLLDWFAAARTAGRPISCRNWRRSGGSPVAGRAFAGIRG